MAETKKTELAKSSLVEEIALAKINQYVELGMVLPDGFNPANSLKKARMMLNDMKVGDKPVLEVCTRESIIQCLIDSCCKGLDYSLNQVYFIPRKNVMTNMESVYGRIARAKRASRHYKPNCQYVHEGDVFEIGVDVTNGKTIIKKHETSLENLDKPIIAAYTFVADDNNDVEVFIMTKREWLTSWKKSASGGAVAKEYERDMIFRTITKKSTKSLVNADIKSVGVSLTDDDDTPLAGDNVEVEVKNTDHTVEDFQEAEVVEEAPIESAKPEPHPQPKQEKADEEDF